MIHDGRCLTPLVDYRNTKANVEALAGCEEGMTAYATDKDEFGAYDGVAWHWSRLDIDHLAGATYVSGQDYVDVNQSSTILDGGIATENAAHDFTIDITSARVFIKTSNSDIAGVVSFDIAASIGVLSMALGMNVLYIDYNGGTPIYATTQDEAADINCRDKFKIGRVFRTGDGYLHFLHSGNRFPNPICKTSIFNRRVWGMVRANGLVTTESSTLALGLAVTAGELWRGLNQFDISDFDSSRNHAITAVNQGTKTFTVAGDQTAIYVYGRNLHVDGSTGNDGGYHVASSTFTGGNTEIVVAEAIPSAVADGNLHYDTFVHVWLNAGSWDLLDFANITVDNVQYNDISTPGSEVLANVTPNQFGIFWVYEDFEGVLLVLYGQGSYKLADAEIATAPATVPDWADEFTVLVAKVIVKRNGVNLTSIATAWETTFAHGAVTQHNDTGGLNEGDYKHQTAAEYTATQAILANQAVAEVLSGPLSGADAAATFKHLAQVGVAAGLGDMLFTKDDGLLLLGPGCPISPTEWKTLRGQIVILSGAFHQEAGRGPETRNIVVEGAGLNYELAPRMIEAGATGLAFGWTYLDNFGSGGSATKDIVPHPVAERGWLQRFTYTAAAGDVADSCLLYDDTAVGSFVQGDDVTISIDAKGSLTGCVFRIVGQEVDAAGVGGTTHTGPNLTLTHSLQRVEHTFTTVDADCSRIRIQCNFASVDNGDSFDVWFGAINCEKKLYSTSFLHGELSWCSWGGAADASTTIRVGTKCELDNHVDLINDNNTATFMLRAQMPYDYDAAWPVISRNRLFGLRGANDSNRVFLGWHQTNHQWEVYINGGYRIQVADTFSKGDRKSFVITFDYTNDLYILSIDGVVAGSSTTALTAPTGVVSWALSGTYDGGNQCGFVIDEFAVLDSILTADEIAAFHQCPTPLVDADALTPPVIDGHWLRLPVSTDNVSNPPTDAELTIAFGYQPDGFTGLVDDNDAGATIWKIWRAGGQWWYEGLTAAV